MVGHAAFLDGKSIGVKDRQPDYREVELVAGRPDDNGNAGCYQVKFADERRRKAIAQGWQRFLRRTHFSCRHIGVDGLGKVGLMLVGFGEILMKVGRKPDLIAGNALEMTQQNDSVAGELMQIECMTAPGARDMRLAGELRPRRLQL